MDTTHMPNEQAKSIGHGAEKRDNQARKYETKRN